MVHRRSRATAAGGDGAEAAGDDWEFLSVRRCCSSGVGSAAAAVGKGSIARSETGPQGGATAVFAGATMPR